MRDDAPPGFVGYLKLTSEPDGHGMRGALFLVNSRGEPIDFSFSRVDVQASFLWRSGEARIRAVAELLRVLFRAAAHVPELIVAMADEVPPRVFGAEIDVSLPVCRLMGAGGPAHHVDDTIEELSDVLHVFWVGPSPAAGSRARVLIETLLARESFVEPFERAELGLEEAFAAR